MRRIYSSIILTIALIVTSTNAKSQDFRTVTLQQSDKLQVFYGADAFKNALAASGKGDLLTLSEGTFNVPAVIDKAVRIQGPGYTKDFKLNGGITIELPEGEEGLVVEGLRFSNAVWVKGNIVNMTFKRCMFTYLWGDTYSLMFLSDSKGVRIEQCRINYLQPDANCVDMKVMNSTISQVRTTNLSSSLLFESCFAKYISGYALCRNCLFQEVNLEPDALMQNCVWWGGSGSANCKKENSAKVSYIGFYWDVSSDLSEEDKAKCMEAIGLIPGVTYGEGFTDIPSNPQIVEQDIARDTDSNGKLRVRMKVKAQQ